MSSFSVQAIYLIYLRICRSSGLDPAGPSYKGHNIAGRLDPTDAQFVDVTHTNGEPIASGGAAMYDASGNVDFYVNGGKQQPGCPNILTAILHGKCM